MYPVPREKRGKVALIFYSYSNVYVNIYYMVKTYIFNLRQNIACSFGTHAVVQGLPIFYRMLLDIYVMVNTP